MWGRRTVLTRKHNPGNFVEILVEEFIQPIGLTQDAPAEAMGVALKHVNDRLNVQRRSDLWEAMHSPRERERIERARPLTVAA
jgi:plasmid maintenance system antidote protein VapI